MTEFILHPIVGDGAFVMNHKRSAVAATLVVLAAYYLFDMEYILRSIRNCLELTLQTHVTNAVPYEGKKAL